MPNDTQWLKQAVLDACKPGATVYSAPPAPDDDPTDWPAATAWRCTPRQRRL